LPKKRNQVIFADLVYGDDVWPLHEPFGAMEKTIVEGVY
jgi:hypothetical protein